MFVRVLGFVGEMDENTGQTLSSLAITEKRTHRPGGCVGIFFQLFDWNRRFAKKKLFSKKLLPPGSLLLFSLLLTHTLSHTEAAHKHSYIHVPFDKMW